MDQIRLIPGYSIYQMIQEKNSAVEKYKSQYLDYVQKKDYYDQAVTIKDDQPWDYSETLNPQYIVASDREKLGMTFTKPSVPLQPYRPWQYEGPNFQNTDAWDGYGKPTSYVFEMQQGSATNQAWKNFGVHGYSTQPGKSFRDGDLNQCIETYMTLTLVPSEKLQYD